MTEQQVDQRVEAKRVGVFMAGASRVEELNQLLDPWHTYAQRERRSFWRQYGEHLAKVAYMDALTMRDAR